MRPLRIATRASELALRRARAIQALLAVRAVESELVTFRTAGDKRFEEFLPPASTKTFFTHELDVALAKGKVDVAVHAYSDVSTDAVAGVAVAAVTRREDARDVLVVNEIIEATSLGELPRGTRIGTSSVRCRGF